MYKTLLHKSGHTHIYIHTHTCSHLYPYSLLILPVSVHISLPMIYAQIQAG